MKNSILTINSITRIVSNTLIKLPTPFTISYFWNFGSLLGMCLIIQIIRGVLLSIHYINTIRFSFERVLHIIRDVNIGWLIRFFHINGASIFFIFIFLHITRGLLFSSFKLKETWITGVIILFILIATAFLGYVLPWGQMSFWGATVITNLMSAIPYLGLIIVEWLWGGFSVDNPTLSRFFSLHFLLPFILAILVVIHITILHSTGSTNPLGFKRNSDKISFHPFFSSKDLLGVVLVILLFSIVCFIYPYILGDPENFNPANPINTPIHIQPEWYFLFAYAILRRIPNKLGGVIALVISILIISFLTLKKKYKRSHKFNLFQKFTFALLSSFFLLLTWIGANPVEIPYILIGKMLSFVYFFCIFIY